VIREIFGVAFVALDYALLLWITFRRNRGNRLVEYGVVAIASFFAMLILFWIPDVPFWIPGSLMGLVILLCFATLYWFARRIFASLRRKSP